MAFVAIHNACEEPSDVCREGGGVTEMGRCRARDQLRAHSVVDPARHLCFTEY